MSFIDYACLVVVLYNVSAAVLLQRLHDLAAAPDDLADEVLLDHHDDRGHLLLGLLRGRHHSVSRRQGDPRRGLREKGYS